MGLFGGDGLDYEPEGEYVTKKRVGKVEDVLDDDEQVMYLTRGSTIDVEGGGSNKSLFDDDRSRKSGTRGWVRAAFTQKRVVVKVPQWLGSDERSIPYSNITSVDLDTGWVKKRITLQTPGPTYHIEADEPGKGECRAAVRFIREKMTEANQLMSVESEPDPMEQLERLKSLHDDGVVTDDEFEEKKQALLDKI